MKIVNKIFASFTIATVSVLFAGCEKNYYDCPEGGVSQNQITLSSEVQFGATPRLQDEQIVNGQSLSLFVTRTGSVADDDIVYNNNRITANGIGGFTYRIPMYYPSDGTNVDFYAIHPYAANASLATPLTFNIQTDQTSVVNYLNSDLLFGGRNNVDAKVDAIPLTFYHKLTKLDFEITTSDASIDLNKLTAITVLGLLPQTTINVQNGVITEATGTVAPVLVYRDPVVPTVQEGQVLTGFTAIIIPQTAPAEQQLFGLEIDGVQRYYTPLTALPFDSGSKYKVKLDVTDEGITLTSQIGDWTDGGSIGGPAGPQ